MGVAEICTTPAPGAARSQSTPAGSASAPGYRRRRPETTILYQLFQQHLATFLAGPGRDLPCHVRRELDRFLACGILARGFARVHCPTCNQSALVAFACKARAVCPSCTGRRMTETAAHLCDHVLPEVPVRQWVLSLPHSIRFLMARDPAVLRLCRGIFVRAVQSFYARRARDEGHPDGRTGSVVCVQRFDSALRMDLHFHALVLDGVYTGFGPAEKLVFQEATPLRDTEVDQLVRHIRNLITGRLQRMGLLDADARLDPEDGLELDTLSTWHAAAIQGLIPFGERAGQLTAMLEEREPQPRPAVKKRLCADHRGFSLHAAVHIGACNRPRLERLCRYIARPPFAQDRLAVLPNGHIAYRFRRAWKNGRTGVVLDPMTFLSRLAAQVPPPRRHGLTYHGVLAPAASRRAEIVPGHDENEARHDRHARTEHNDTAPSASKPTRIRPERYSWAELMRRAFEVDLLQCPCGGRRKVLSLVCDPAQIRRVLEHMGLQADPPERAPPRAAQGMMPFRMAAE